MAPGHKDFQRDERVSLLGRRVLDPVEPFEDALRGDLGQWRRSEVEVPRDEAFVIPRGARATALLHLFDVFGERLIEADDAKRGARKRPCCGYGFGLGAGYSKGRIGKRPITLSARGAPCITIQDFECSLTRMPNPGVVVSQALNCLSGFGFRARTAISVRCRRIN